MRPCCHHFWLAMKSSYFSLEGYFFYWELFISFTQVTVGILKWWLYLVCFYKVLFYLLLLSPTEDGAVAEFGKMSENKEQMAWFCSYHSKGEILEQGLVKFFLFPLWRDSIKPKLLYLGFELMFKSNMFHNIRSIQEWPYWRNFE